MDRQSSNKRSLLFVFVVSASLAVGCGGAPKEPRIEAFVGRLVASGEPVRFDSGERVFLRMHHKDSARDYGVPVSVDGEFKIGWMPIGEYLVSLLRRQPGQGERQQNTYQVPGGYSLTENQDEFIVELGEGFEP